MASAAKNSGPAHLLPGYKTQKRPLTRLFAPLRFYPDSENPESSARPAFLLTALLMHSLLPFQPVVPLASVSRGRTPYR